MYTLFQLLKKQRRSPEAVEIFTSGFHSKFIKTNKQAEEKNPRK